MQHHPHDKFDQDLQFVMQCFRDVLSELHHDDLLPSLPWLESSKLANQKLETAAPQRLVQLLSISFQLLNMVEENTNVQQRRAQQSHGSLEAETGLWPWSLHELQRQGFDEVAIQDVIRHLEVELVLTAHPTEAKRATVLEHHRDLYVLLVKRENQMWTPVEQEWLRADVKTVLERLWRTGEIYLQRPDVAAELRNVMHYLKNVFPEVLGWLDRRFESAWEEAGFTHRPQYMQQQYPSFALGTWVGGDRDGHPLVTAAITHDALRSLRLNALIVLRHRLGDLAQKISLSDMVQPPPEVLRARLAHYADAEPALYEAAMQRNPAESWRALVNIMINRLPIQIVRDHATQLDERLGCYQDPAAVFEDFAVLHASLEEIGADRIAQSELKAAVRMLQTMGFHSARLDIRQNSQFHDKALAQLLALAGIPDAETYPSWSGERKAELVARELLTLRPLRLPQQELNGEAEAVLSCLEEVRNYIKAYGYEGIGSLIVSMTHTSSDLFTVYLLAREAGLMLREDATLICPIPVVPLFETIDDLRASIRIMDEFLSHPITVASLQQQRRGRVRPLQQIMIGYSDSSKDGGILASQWNLYQAQKELFGLADRHGVDFCFFHGRGGTVSRGAGPIHRFLQALPKGSLNGSFRMTEQGETIARKYANSATAVYNLELLLASLTAETLGNQQKVEDEPFMIEVLSQLSDTSQQVYQQLIHDPQFMAFYRQATPIDVLEHARIGSRPPKRTGQATLDDLRAIPWVFSWNQARFYLPSWYGVGTALARFEASQADGFARLRRELPQLELLNYVLFNVETTVASASEEIMAWYAGLVADEALRDSFMSRITRELQLTQQMLAKIFGSSIEQRRPHVMKTITLRESGLRVLHQLQIQQIRSWREAPAGSELSEQRLEDLLLTINAIASGLRNTG